MMGCSRDECSLAAAAVDGRLAMSMAALGAGNGGSTRRRGSCRCDGRRRGTVEEDRYKEGGLSGSQFSGLGRSGYSEMIRVDK